MKPIYNSCKRATTGSRVGQVSCALFIACIINCNKGGLVHLRRLNGHVNERGAGGKRRGASVADIDAKPSPSRKKNSFSRSTAGGDREGRGAAEKAVEASSRAQSRR